MSLMFIGHSHHSQDFPRPPQGKWSVLRLGCAVCLRSTQCTAHGTSKRTAEPTPMPCGNRLDVPCPPPPILLVKPFILRYTEVGPPPPPPPPPLPPSPTRVSSGLLLAPC
ncbi:uncharacterized protein K489DRAFT_375524 [Dissoconium aciculare CBS 342.82]|uniref:Uncharacterized protein n=1 Tax=Dissoconium aciculare CBS 342.82 TaxID=1314786 RepID=A0A6J3MKF0_9PEZI|nr:uncharacterized protein K489DRAFT_375524 [Dissoconium aciculare CBS 342.82]KAF1827432.1 hypothetical protein K489DRAFT_375524 [Dissoconium aciculare CBS 342.82]